MVYEIKLKRFVNMYYSIISDQELPQKLLGANVIVNAHDLFCQSNDVKAAELSVLNVIRASQKYGWN